jgi:chemotaxis protein methyltransferase CheR
MSGARNRTPAAGFTNSAFARIGELALLFAGLVFPPNRQPSAEAGMRRAMHALGISDPQALLRAVEMPGDVRDAVLAELTVGESYFFRDSAQLELLATEILPARIERYGPSRPLRIWSAGCASGEEPYTLAIMLRELGWPHPLRIIGTDIARPRLAAAQRARYTRWALRGVSDDRIARWFDRHGIYYDLAGTIRESVEFRLLNLVLDECESVERGAEGFDLVLCRNVMIYFDLPTVSLIAARLLASLAPDGWLILGASDPPLAHLVRCEVVVTPAGIAYRRADSVGGKTELRAPVPQSESRPDPESVSPLEIGDTVAAAPSTIEQTPELSLDAKAHGLRVVHHRAKHPLATDDILHAYALADYPAAETMAIAALATATHDADTLRIWIAYVRAVANQGRLHEAGDLCARSLQLHPLAAELHYLHATLLAEAGWFGDAATAARRALYLDRRLVMGHLLLGDALTRIADPAGARIAFQNVVHLLSDVSPEAPVTAADGVPSARLRQIATLRLRTLVPEVQR